MKERPILFSAPMVRAILDRRKPVPRRREVIHCIHCGGYLSERQQYTGCPKCGGDNAP